MAMQTRCLNCLREQYMLAVLAVSTGEHPCVWCGVKSEPMTRDEYVDRLAAARAATDPETLRRRPAGKWGSVEQGMGPPAEPGVEPLQPPLPDTPDH